MEKTFVAVRGAIQIPRDDPESIQNGIKKLFETLWEENPAIHFSSCIDIMFTVTDDLKSLNPATALRKSFDAVSSPLFCMQEPKINGMMPRVIRVMLHAYVPEGTEVQHAYLGGTQSLRPDIMLRS